MSGVDVDGGGGQDAVPALAQAHLTPRGRVILAAIEAAHIDGLLYGGSSLDPSGWSTSTFPEAARRIDAALDESRDMQAVASLRLEEPNEPDRPGPWYDGWHAALDAVEALLT